MSLVEIINETHRESVVQIKYVMMDTKWRIFSALDGVIKWYDRWVSTSWNAELTLCGCIVPCCMFGSESMGNMRTNIR